MSASLSTMQYYNDLAPLYDQATANGAWLPNLLVQTEVSDLPGPTKSALDLGCGTGQTLEVLLDMLNPTRAVGVDFSASMCEVTKRKLPAVEVINSDIELFCHTSSEHFDVVTAVGVLEFVSEMPRLLGQLGDRLRSGGSLIFTYEPLIEGSTQQSERRTVSPASRSFTSSDFITYRWTPREVEAAVAEWAMVQSNRLFIAYVRGSTPVVYGFLRVFKQP